MSTMMDVIRTRVPACLSGYDCDDTDALAQHKRFCGSEYVAKSIGCLCGNDLLFVDIVKRKALKGVCSKSEFMAYEPPVYTQCCACNRSRSLFDPVIHGWKGESGLVPEDEATPRLSRYSLKPGLVYVVYSFSNVRDYEQLIARGIDDIENYFDTFALLFSGENSSKITEILAARCL